MECKKIMLTEFQSTPSPRRETDILEIIKNPTDISIHSLPKEGDDFQRRQVLALIDFNPLPPQGGRPMSSCNGHTCIYFNPLPPQGGRLTSMRAYYTRQAFQSTPSPRRETSRWDGTASQSSYFNPLPPQGGRHLVPPKNICLCTISIHSLPKEGDQQALHSPYGRI